MKFFSFVHDRMTTSLAPSILANGRKLVDINQEWTSSLMAKSNTGAITYCCGKSVIIGGLAVAIKERTTLITLSSSSHKKIDTVQAWLMMLPIFGIFLPPADRILMQSKDSTVARNALSGRGDLWRFFVDPAAACSRVIRRLAINHFLGWIDPSLFLRDDDQKWAANEKVQPSKPFSFLFLRNFQRKNAIVNCCRGGGRYFASSFDFFFFWLRRHDWHLLISSKTTRKADIKLQSLMICYHFYMVPY